MKLVVVGIIKKIEGDREKYLLVSSKKDFGKYTGFYYPPGGHVKGDEDKIAALKREIKEEVGLEITIAEKIAESLGDVPDQTTYWYLCDVRSYKLKLNLDELQDAGYFSKEEFLKLNIWPATLDFFRQYIF